MPGSALPSLRQLRYLVAVSERLNFRQAAADCHVTQSTLSAGIKELESLLEVELVERDTRNVRMTAAGSEVVARARGLLAQAHDLVETGRAAGQPLTGSLHLGEGVDKAGPQDFRIRERSRNHIVLPFQVLDERMVC